MIVADLRLPARQIADLFDLCRAKYHDGASREAVVAMLAARLALDEPHLGDVEVGDYAELLADHTASRNGRDAGGRSAEDDDELLDLELKPTATSDTNRSRVVVRSLRQLRQNPELLRPPTPVIPRLAWAGRVTLLASREKSGKSTLAGSAAAAKSSGGLFAGVRLEAGSVLWVSLEEHAGEVVLRFDTFHANEDRVHVVDTLPDALDSLIEAVKQVQPEFLVIDTLPALVQDLVRDPGSAAEWTPILRRLTALARDTNAAVLLLHHARKSDNTYRDSTAVGANADVILEMAEVEGDPTARALRPKGRWSMDPFTLRLVGDRYEIGAGSVSVETLVLFFVQEHPGCSKRAVREGVQRKATEVDADLDRLIHQGIIEDRGEEGRGHKYYAKSSEAA